MNERKILYKMRVKINKKKKPFEKERFGIFLLIPHVCRRLVCRLYERLCYELGFMLAIFRFLFLNHRLHIYKVF